MPLMEDQPSGRQSFFKYKVLQDTDITRHLRTRGTQWKQQLTECCSCFASLPRCLNLCRFCMVFSASLFVAMAPWAMACTEFVVTLLLYIMVVHPGKIFPLHYGWRTTQQDVLLFSWARSLAVLIAFFLGLGRGLHVPYCVVASVFAAIGLPFVAVKALMFGRLLVSKWGVLLLASALFSIAHLAVAFNVNLWARRRYQMGLLGQDEQAAWLLGGYDLPASYSQDSEVPPAELSDASSCFINCKGLRVHYRVEQPQEERDPKAGILLIHGFGAAAFAWRNIMPGLANVSRCRVYTFDRPAFGLTSRPDVGRQANEAASDNPYSLAFQAQMVLELCKLWGCQRVLLAGHSDGALLALRAAALAARSTPKMYAEVLGSPRTPMQESVSPYGIGSPPANPVGIPSALATPLKLSGVSPAPGNISPFSKWMQLGRPQGPQDLKANIEKACSERTGTNACSDRAPLATRSSNGASISDAGLNDKGEEAEDERAVQGSMALESASALLGPQRDNFSGESTCEAAELYPRVQGPELPVGEDLDAVISSSDVSRKNKEDEEQHQASSSGVGVSVAGLVLLHPSLAGEARPSFARSLASSRVGRRILQRLLRTEIGEFSHRRAWYDSRKLTPEVLSLYKERTAPSQIRGWDAALIEASRVRKEASPSDLAGDFASVAYVPKLLATGVHDRIVPPARVVTLVEQIGGSSRSVMIPSCGHLSHEEAAPDLLAHMSLFAEEVMDSEGKLL